MTFADIARLEHASRMSFALFEETSPAPRPLSAVAAAGLAAAMDLAEAVQARVGRHERSARA